MKKEANFDEVLFSLGQEVIQVLIRRGASLEDAQDAVSQTYTTIFQYYLKLHQKIYARGFPSNI